MQLWDVLRWRGLRRLPILTGLELIKILERIGFKTVRQKGSHAFQRVLSVLLRNAGNNIRDFVD